MNKRIKQTPVERLLVYRLGSLGDTLMALPALRLIRECHPGAEITLLTNVPSQSKAAPLISVLENTDLYQQVISYPLNLRSLPRLRVLQREIAARKFQVAFHLAEDRGRVKDLRDYVFLRLCGIPRVVGTSWNGGPTRRGAGDYEWEAHRLLRRVAPLGTVDLNVDKWWDLGLTAGEMARADELVMGVDKPFLAVSQGTKVEANDWTEPNWTTLLRAINARWPGLSLVMLGSAEEWQRAERCSRDWKGSRVNLCGQSAPRVSGAVLRHARLFIGHDSGPTHLAAVMGVPCVSIYSARNVPGKWFPRGENNSILYHQTECFGCRLETCVEQAKKCILSITVEEVLQAVGGHLATDGAGLARKAGAEKLTHA
jgi:heptosyltransferase III